jgi:hypothetical protein
MGSPLFRESFDSAFIAACSYAGHKIEEAADGQRFWDVIVDGKKISLKSSKAKSLREETLHITKLTEAAWIQDCRSAAKRREHTRRLFENYCDEVDAIVQLRYFQRFNQYELVEIPVSLFSQIIAVGKEYFEADGPTINIPIGKDPPDFTLKLDRSDAKVTIAKINKLFAWCMGYGNFSVPASLFFKPPSQLGPAIPLCSIDDRLCREFAVIPQNPVRSLDEGVKPKTWRC